MCFFACTSAALGPQKAVALAISIAAFGAYLIGEAFFPDDGPMATQYDRCPKVFLSAIALAATVLFWL